MTYKIVDVEGIGEVYSEKLVNAGIKTVDQLLEKGWASCWKTGITP